MTKKPSQQDGNDDVKSRQLRGKGKGTNYDNECDCSYSNLTIGFTGYPWDILSEELLFLEQAFASAYATAVTVATTTTTMTTTCDSGNGIRYLSQVTAREVLLLNDNGDDEDEDGGGNGSSDDNVRFGIEFDVIQTCPQEQHGCFNGDYYDPPRLFSLDGDDDGKSSNRRRRNLNPKKTSALKKIAGGKGRSNKTSKSQKSSKSSSGSSSSSSNSSSKKGKGKGIASSCAKGTKRGKGKGIHNHDFDVCPPPHQEDFLSSLQAKVKEQMEVGNLVNIVGVENFSVVVHSTKLVECGSLSSSPPTTTAITGMPTIAPSQQMQVPTLSPTSLSTVVPPTSSPTTDLRCNRYDTDGWHDGNRIATLPTSASPNGESWEWFECAQECSQTSECEFWTLRLKGDKACILLNNQGEYNDVGGHIEGDRDLDCLLLSPPCNNNNNNNNNGTNATTVSTDLDFFKSELTNNTLHLPGGELRYENIGTISGGNGGGDGGGGGESTDLELDLVVRVAPGTNYTTGAWRNNGKSGDFGVINIQNNFTPERNGEGNFEFCFYEHNDNDDNDNNHNDTDRKVVVDSFRFSVFDIDNRAELVERLLIDPSQFQYYSLDANTEIKVECEEDEDVDDCSKRLVFGTEAPRTVANPSNSSELLPEQLQRSISFTFTQTSCFVVTFQLFCPTDSNCTETSGGRFVFGGTVNDLIPNNNNNNDCEDPISLRSSITTSRSSSRSSTVTTTTTTTTNTTSSSMALLMGLVPSLLVLWGTILCRRRRTSGSKP